MFSADWNCQKFNNRIVKTRIRSKEKRAGLFEECLFERSTCVLPRNYRLLATVGNSESADLTGSQILPLYLNTCRWNREVSALDSSLLASSQWEISLQDE
ncbi:hypothetical protein TNCT_643311 [Trichonephila clavata]|uniref:Uncharacterized protein n=1 Tax=Trichonephila clavata TaxID=2740835 RepID=A0A8X6FZY2_TRICU|nr:hypothetical protein TNCT_643311 [Trichonephila clavata]